MPKSANDSHLQLTLREMRTHILSKQFLIWVSLAIVILTTAGPFGTLERLNNLERLAYWSIITPTTYLIASFCATLIISSLIGAGVNRWLSYAISGTLSGIPVGTFVWIFQLFLTPSFPAKFETWISIVTQVTVVTLAVTLLFASFFKTKETAPSTQTGDQQSVFFTRIPKALGRDIISLNSQDHYVKVTTTLGHELILMRLSDALQELANYDGLQVHRSWWVAKKHIRTITSNNGKKQIHLSNSEIVPVSRSYASNLKNFRR